MRKISIYVGTVLLALPILASARLVPYERSLEDAEGIASVRVIACEQTFDGSFIHSTAMLAVETPITGIEKGVIFKQTFSLSVGSVPRGTVL